MHINIVTTVNKAEFLSDAERFPVVIRFLEPSE